MISGTTESLASYGCVPTYVCIVVQVERTKQNNLRRDVADKPTYNFPFETVERQAGV